MINPVVSNGRPAGKIASLPQSLIGEDLDVVERLLQQTLAPYRASFGALVKYLNHYRGKRLRPTLLLLVARACGNVAPAHHTLAAVVEMIHTATLVHDDVLDEADTRRHVRTVNAAWGNKISILLGDLLFTNAFHLTSTIGDARACEWIDEATNRVCAGELLQTVERGNMNLTEGNYFAVIEGKTAALTECCGRLGAFYAGADPEQVQRLARFGRNLGIAFQIADDVLDLVGSEQTAGKTLGTDLAQRKLTLPLIHLLDRASTREADEFRRLLQQQDGDFRELYDAMRETGALEAAQLRAEEFAEQARHSLRELPATPERAVLEAIARWAVRRDT
jgi:octaprenyl-diphosphate synthase